MGIADLFRPKYRHSDVRVRTEAVRALTSDDAALLTQIARTDRDIGVRRIAIGKIDEADVLAEIAAGEAERSLRDFAGERAASLWSSLACGDDADRAAAALAGIIKLGDQSALVDVVVKAALPAIRNTAFNKISDPRALADVAKREAPQDLRKLAVDRIDDGDILRALAIDTTSKEVGLAAVDRIDDPDGLESVAQKAKTKAVRQRARKIVGEIEEAERAKKPGVSDEVKRRRAEKAQLAREVEAVADSFDFVKAAEVVRAGEAAYAKLEADDGDDRFAKTVERFWKRKEIHDTQARTSQELRVIEREAREDKERAAAEREPEPARPEVVDPKRAAREAEAKARREEKERQRAEEEARKAAVLAEREAKRKEDAERGVAIAASLTAMCEDMEQLGAGDKVDPRAIDRVLAQAAKAFEQIGKVAAKERDVLADRYTAARGKLVIRVSELREAQDWERWANVPKAEALIQTAKQMVEAPTTPDLGNRLRQLQALWKEVGPMPQRRSKELWEQFKATCDQVYDKVKGVRAVEQEKFAEAAKVKEALIAEAEVLADSTEFAATADKLKALQQKWKASGHLPRKQGDDLWKRFRAACDRFFERRKPVLDAQRAQEADNLANKQALIARAAAIAEAAPGDGGWGQAIGEIKDLQRQWKEIGYVPRRDADAVYRAFRAACDTLFRKRDEARDGEANAHRAEIDALKTEIEAIATHAPTGVAEGDVDRPYQDVVARAVAARAKAKELGVLAADIAAMVRHVIEAHPNAVKGTELDPAALRARRDKLIAKAEELLPKSAAVTAGGGDLAAQLKAAMQQNAFGDLRFSGRDPLEVIDDLRAQWAEAGPLVDDEDRAQEAKFDDIAARVLDAVAKSVPTSAGAASSGAGGARARADEPNERGGRRRRRERRSAEQPIAPAAPKSTADEITAPAPPVPVAAHDAITTPVDVLPVVEAPPLPTPEPQRARRLSDAPPMDDIDTGWELGDEDPTAEPEPEASPPSASELAGDGSTEGDGIDTGWD